MPVNPDQFEILLKKTAYREEEINFIYQGFRHGFDLQYTGPKNRCNTSKNIPFTVRDELDMWNKVMKEVREERFAGPYINIPFKNYVQSPIGLVPKSGGKTRLIFYLSYDFGELEHQKSVNYYIPKEICYVKYHDLDEAVKFCLKAKEEIGRVFGNATGHLVFFSKVDGLSAFRQVPLLKKYWSVLILVAEDPRDGIWKYFMDKCLPFGASISCAIYQRISDA